VQGYTTKQWQMSKGHIKEPGKMTDTKCKEWFGFLQNPNQNFAIVMVWIRIIPKRLMC
jgi:hypothetical protein